MLEEYLEAHEHQHDAVEHIGDGAEKQLHQQNLEISSLGSIAEASLQLKGVFQTAQDAADMYIAAAKSTPKKSRKLPAKKLQRFSLRQMNRHTALKVNNRI